MPMPFTPHRKHCSPMFMMEALPFLCFYDIEKAFDLVELPILLRQLHTIGLDGKFWRLLKKRIGIPHPKLESE